MSEQHIFNFLCNCFGRPFDGSAYLYDLTVLPYEAGLYCVANGNKVVYLGVSQDLKQRWKSHHKFNRIVEEYPYTSSVFYYLHPAETNLWKLEIQILDMFYFPLNGTGARLEEEYRKNEPAIRNTPHTRTKVIYQQ